jgi:hypothetical protein
MSRRTRQEMSGIFDYFKKSKQKSLFESGPLIPAPSQLPAAPREERDIFALFDPKAQLPAAPKKSFFSRFLPPVPVVPSTTAPKKRDIFDVIVREEKPTAQREEAPPSQPMAEWKEMFPGKEGPPISGMFDKIVTPEEIPPRYVLINPSVPPEKTPIRPRGLPAPSTSPVVEWAFPSAADLAAHFQRTMNLPEIWDMIRTIRATPEFKKDQLIYSWQGIPMMIPVDPVVYREEYTDFANFYGIPWGVIQMYVDVPPEYQKAGEDALWNSVLSPLNSLLPEAFDMLKPRDIPGFFNVSFMEPNKEYWLNYVEPKLEGVIPPPGGFGGA